MRDDEELEEESITGYYAKNGSYVVEDRHELANDGKATLKINYVPQSYYKPELVSASFTVIRSFELLKGKIALKDVLSRQG
jgi:ABC-type uncharacterized transport system ATPase subunit